MIRFSSLGDVVHSSAAIDPFLQAGYEVFFLTKPAFAPLLKNIKGVNIYEYQSTQEPKSREDFFAWLKTQNFQLILDLHDSWRSWRWRGELKQSAPVWVAKKPRWLELAIILLRARKTFSLGRGGRALRYRNLALSALAKSDNTGSIPLTRLEISAEESRSVEALLPQNDFVALLPSSAWPGKEWPHFAALSAHLAKNIPVVVLGGEKDLVCDAVAEAAKPFAPQSISLRGKTSLRQSMAILARAKWIIGNDTGLLHAAEALGKDVAVIEGPTQESLGFSPYRTGSVLLGLPLICRPCSKSGQFCVRLGSRKCLNDLSLEQVSETLRARGYPC